MAFVAHIECTVCGRHHPPGELLTVCVACGQMLAVRYDLPGVAAAVSKDELGHRPPGMYRFRELLPLEDGEEPVTLGEGGTPLLPLPRLGAHLGLRHLWAKDEGQNPTGTFKARGLGMAVTRARTLGVKGLMIPSAGNAGGAAAVYGARAGLPVAVVVPRGTAEAAIAEAILAGYPVVDLKVTLYDGSYHDVDSSDMAFQIAASMGLQKGFMEARPCLLEPIMNVEVVAPAENAGDVIGDLNGRRGRILGMEPAGEVVAVRAQVPMAEMLTYESSLRSMTGGRGGYSMEFSHYDEVPGQLAEKVVAAAKAEKEKQ